MIEEKVTITNSVGLHSRPASRFLREACKFQSDITLIKEGRAYNGKSIISILAMAAKKGNEIILRCEGEDEKEALEYLTHVIRKKLDLTDKML